MLKTPIGDEATYLFILKIQEMVTNECAKTWSCKSQKKKKKPKLIEIDSRSTSKQSAQPVRPVIPNNVLTVIWSFVELQALLSVNSLLSSKVRTTIAESKLISYQTHILIHFDHFDDLSKIKFYLQLGKILTFKISSSKIENWNILDNLRLFCEQNNKICNFWLSFDDASGYNHLINKYKAVKNRITEVSFSTLIQNSKSL